MEINDKDKQQATDAPSVEVVNTDEPKGDKVLTIGIIVAVVIIILSLLYWFFGIDKNGNGVDDEVIGDDTELLDDTVMDDDNDSDILTDDGDAVFSDTDTASSNGVVAGQATGVVSSGAVVNGNVAYTGEVQSQGVVVYTAVLADPNLFDFSNEYTRGCDVLVMIPHTIAPTPRVLNTALALLFTDEYDYGFPPANFISTQEDLAFSYATITNGVANVYLTGEVGPINGVCDVPRIETQITETALQFPTVQAVRIFLNNEPLIVE